MSVFSADNRCDGFNDPFHPTQASESLQDEALLQYYAREWDRYTTGANYINRLFTYLNRHWVKRERDEGRKGVYPVYTVRLSSLRSFTVRSGVHVDHAILPLVDAAAVVFGAMEKQLLHPYPK